MEEERRSGSRASAPSSEAEVKRKSRSGHVPREGDRYVAEFHPFEVLEPLGLGVTYVIHDSRLVRKIELPRSNRPASGKTRTTPARAK